MPQETLEHPRAAANRPREWLSRETGDADPTASRVIASYDIAQETITGLTGRHHTGWVAYHVDL